MRRSFLVRNLQTKSPEETGRNVIQQYRKISRLIRDYTFLLGFHMSIVFRYSWKRPWSHFIFNKSECFACWLSAITTTSTWTTEVKVNGFLVSFACCETSKVALRWMPDKHDNFLKIFADVLWNSPCKIVKWHCNQQLMTIIYVFKYYLCRIFNAGKWVFNGSNDKMILNNI